MPEATAEVTETGTEEAEQSSQSSDQLPGDHPLVKTLDAQKTEIKALKAKAKRLDELEEAQKTQAERDGDRIAKAEAEAATVPGKVAESLKAHLVTLHEIDSQDAELFLTATDPDLLLKQVERLLGQSGKRQRKNYVAREGENHSAASNEDTAFVREFFSG